MRLPGRLNKTTLGDLLGAAYRERITGTLQFEEFAGPEAGRTHAIYLEEGLIVRIDTGGGTAPIGRLLVEHGIISAERLCQALRQRPAEPDGPIGAWLVDGGYIDRTRMQLTLEHQLEIRLEALFALKDAKLSFRVRRPRDHRRDAPRPLRPPDFLPGRPRARQAGGMHKPGSLRPARTDPVRGHLLAVLELPESAGAADVRGAFRRLASRYHPDRHPEASHEEKSELLHRFAELSHAYHALIAWEAIR